MKTFDVIVIGGGPGGSAAALTAAARGHSALLLDRGRSPRDKSCGEGIQPGGVRALLELGVPDEPHRIGAAPFRRVVFYDRFGEPLAGEFPDRQAGWGMRRTDLDRILQELCRRRPTLELREGVRVTSVSPADGGWRVQGEGADGERSVFHGRAVIGADGIDSVLHALDPYRMRSPTRRRFGAKVYLAGWKQETPSVEVHLSAGVEVYLTPQINGETTLALLADENRFAEWGRTPLEQWPRLLERFAGLKDRLSSVRLTGPLRGAGPLGSQVFPVAFEGTFLVGDSSGALDPITGEGIGLALREGILAGEAVSDALSGRISMNEAVRRYRDRHARLTGSKRFLNWVAFSLSRRPALADFALRKLREMPFLYRKMLSIAAK